MSDNIELTPNNFCYLSQCDYFNSNILSSGCRLDYMSEEDITNMKEEAVCPLQLERMYRKDDPIWNSEEDPFTVLSEAFQKAKKELNAEEVETNDPCEGIPQVCDKLCSRIKDEDHAAELEELMDEEMDLKQDIYDAKIELEIAQLALQDFLEIYKHKKC